MRWIMLLGIIVFVSGCAYTEVYPHRQVAVAPAVMEPAMVYPYSQPIDVTTTTIDYY